MYLPTKFHLTTSSGLGSVIYTAMGLAATLDPRWRLFKNVGLSRYLLLLIYLHTKFAVSTSSSLALEL